MSNFLSVPSLKNSWLLKIAVSIVAVILIIGFINFIRSDNYSNLFGILYFLGFLIGILSLEKIISTLFPNRGRILRYLSSASIFKYTNSPHWVMLFSIGLALAYWYNAPKWVFIILAIIGAVTLLRIIDTIKK